MLADHLRAGLDIVFCGTAAGRMSALRGHYYAGRGNRFWPMMAETGLTPRLLRPEEDYLLPDLGLGLTDLAKGVSGPDSAIPQSAYTPARVAELIARYLPRAVAFTSLTAAKRALGTRHPAGRVALSPWRGVAVFVLPSPSGMARGHWSAEPWHDLARWRAA